MIKLIASDIDGTLVSNGYGTMNPEIFKLIKAFQKKGIRFMAASGRQHANLVNLFEPVYDSIDYICENGSLIFLDGNVVSETYMPRDLGLEIIEAIMVQPGAEIMISGKETCYILPKESSYEDTVRNVVKNDVTVVNDIMRTPEPYYKISLVIKAGVDERTIDYWQRLFGDEATVVYGGNNWIDLMPKGVDKGSAMEKVMDLRGITRNEVMAFGDNYNDETMLNVVEYSYAMKSAPREILDFVYGTCTDVTEVLKKFLSTL